MQIEVIFRPYLWWPIYAKHSPLAISNFAQGDKMYNVHTRYVYVQHIGHPEDNFLFSRPPLQQMATIDLGSLTLETEVKI